MTFFSWRVSFLSSLDEEMKKWLTAADIRREIVTGLTEWFEQTDTLEAAAAAAEDAESEIRMVTDEDDTDDSDSDSDSDSDYNSVDAERDAQEDNDNDDDDDDGKPTPKTQTTIPPSYEWSHFFRGYIDKKWVEDQEKFHRDSGHDKQKFTGTQWATKLIRFQWQAAHEVWIQRCKELHDTEDGILTAREMQELQAKTRAMYSSAHLLNIHDRQIFNKPIDERLDSRLSDLKAWVQQLYPVVQKGIQDAHEQVRDGFQDIRNFLIRIAPQPGIQ